MGRAVAEPNPQQNIKANDTRMQATIIQPNYQPSEVSSHTTLTSALQPDNAVLQNIRNIVKLQQEMTTGIKKQYLVPMQEYISNNTVHKTVTLAQHTRVFKLTKLLHVMCELNNIEDSLEDWYCNAVTHLDKNAANILHKVLYNMEKEIKTIKNTWDIVENLEIPTIEEISEDKIQPAENEKDLDLIKKEVASLNKDLYDPMEVEEKCDAKKREEKMSSANAYVNKPPDIMSISIESKIYILHCAIEALVNSLAMLIMSVAIDKIPPSKFICFSEADLNKLILDLPIPYIV